MTHSKFYSKLILTTALVVVFAAGVLSTTPAFASESRAYLHSYNLPAHGIAIEGYSPVAYFTEAKAVRGTRDFAVEHDGVTYYLASAREQELFRNSPDKYVPAYGSWCAFGMSIQDKFPIDPHNFKIVNGKLNLFLKNKGIDALALWNKGNEEDFAAKAAAHWKKVSQ